MKIGVYDPYLDTLSGGERYMLSIAKCLSDKNTVDVIWDDGEIKQKALDKLNIDLEKVRIVGNFFTKNVSTRERLLRSRKYDLLIILSDGSIPLSFSGKTYLHFQHPVEWVKPDIKTKLKLTKINKIICNSFFTKEFIDKKFGVNSVVLYPPFGSDKDNNTSEFPDMKQKENIILTVGRLSPDGKGGDIKKIKVLIEAFKSMVDEGLMNWKLAAAVSHTGENSYLVKNIEESAKKYPVKIIKNCGYDELTKLYKRAKIYWHAAGFGEDLNKNPEKAEHFGITTVEAISCGAVPVVFNGGGQREIVAENIDGYLWDDIENLKYKTKKIMLDRMIREEMNQLGRRKIEKFSYENFCSRLKELIK